MDHAASPDGRLNWLRRHAFLLLAAGALAAGVALAAPRLLWGPRVPVVAVEEREFLHTIVASGRVEAPHRVGLGAQITGVVTEVLATEGARVAAGAPLIALDTIELKATLAQADSGVRQAEARLRQVREVQAPVAEQALRQAQSNHALAQSALARNRELFAKGFVGQAALDEALRAERVAEAQFRTAERQLAGAGPAGSDLAAARATLAQARASAQAAQARLAYATVRAPVAGTVIQRTVEPGDTVQPGKVLLLLSPDGETQLVAQIDEKHMGLLRPGQPALASADAYERERFAAELVFIHPGVDAQRGSVEVKLRVPQPPAYLRQDMTVSVDIEVARRPRALLVPAQALRDTSEGTHVWKVADGRVLRQPVRLGLRANGWAEVLEGLRAGDLLVPVGTPRVTEESRLRPVAAAP